jgi:mannonate dehydratase
MRVAMATFVPPTIDRLKFMKQLGLNDVIIWGTTFRPRPSNAYGDLPLTQKELSFRELVILRQMIEDVGLKLTAIENLPHHFTDQLILGGPDRDEQAHHLQNTLAAIARSGVPFFGYNWMPTGVWRTSYSHPIRGGAAATAFDAALLNNAPLVSRREYSEQEFWENYHYFLEVVIPVAEAEGIKLALHPNDPPVEQIGGLPCLFRSIANFQRAMDILPSPNHGLIICLGAWSETGENLFDVLQHFGRQHKLFYCHFQAVRGSVPIFHESFVDDADYNPIELLLALRNQGFEGVMIPGHVPQIEGDSEWRTTESAAETPYYHPMGGHRARAYTVGFLKGALEAIQHVPQLSDLRTDDL